MLMVGLLRECLGFSGLLAYPKTSLVRYMRKTRQEMIELEIVETRKYYEVLKLLGNDVPYIDPRLEHILVTGMMNAYFEMMIHDMPLDDAVHYLEELNDFYTAGWIKIMGQ